jgi:hypothetical protein
LFLLRRRSNNGCEAVMRLPEPSLSGTTPSGGRAGNRVGHRHHADTPNIEKQVIPLPLSTLARPRSRPGAIPTCMSACEACVLACGECAAWLRQSETPHAGLLYELSVCVHVCELALHAMSRGGEILPAACAASARSCEALARKCMLLPEPQFRSCVRACYRAAQECSRVAQGRAGESHLGVAAAAPSCLAVQVDP